MDMKLNGKILVADDNSSNQLLIKILLTRMGLEVTIVGHGRSVLEKLESESFDLILMDIQMPIMTGYEATETIRKKGNKIPIIALTASTSLGDVRKCMDCGCNDYLRKPINKETLYETLKKYLEANACGTGSADQKFEEKDFISAIADDEDLQPVIDVFIEDLPRLLDNINNANNVEDIELIKSFAHELKGSSGSAGFEVLEDYAADLEKTVLEGQLETAQKTVDQINNFCKILIGKLNT